MLIKYVSTAYIFHDVSDREKENKNPAFLPQPKNNQATSIELIINLAWTVKQYNNKLVFKQKCSLTFSANRSLLIN